MSSDARMQEIKTISRAAERQLCGRLPPYPKQAKISFELPVCNDAGSWRGDRTAFE